MCLTVFAETEMFELLLQTNQEESSAEEYILKNLLTR